MFGRCTGYEKLVGVVIDGKQNEVTGEGDLHGHGKAHATQLGRGDGRLHARLPRAGRNGGKGTKQDFMQTRHEAQRNVGWSYVRLEDIKSVLVAQGGVVDEQSMWRRTERSFSWEERRNLRSRCDNILFAQICVIRRMSLSRMMQTPVRRVAQ
ncbi:hypothetical protein EV356DRAFT_511848 [Viridothelium virens]|uniref:Uncharacterized protein n=1 Tax=Viridothelium virens TaxID=1048519 RepID=A0A6A6HG69_VIRVR|nr:hypothetical protein EV356DRAFT_511848 [Viridothelium virens]